MPRGPGAGAPYECGPPCIAGGRAAPSSRRPPLPGPFSPARGRSPRREPGGRARGPGACGRMPLRTARPFTEAAPPRPAPLGGRPARRGRSAGIPRDPLCRPPAAPAGQGPGARPAGTVRGRRFSCRELGRPPCPASLSEKEIVGSSLERPPLFGNGPAGLSASAHLDDQRHGASPAGFLPSAALAEGTGRSRRSRYVCETWRPIFPSPGGLPSGIINPCATAADRRAGAGTLRTGYRGWSDRESPPSGTDALDHTNSKYERMCTEVLLDKVCPSGRPHHFLTKKLFSIEWIRSARSWPDGRLASNTYGDVSHPPLDGEFDPGSG